MYPLLTIGHSNHTIDTFLGLLKQNEVACLIDVRTKPKSQYHPQFRRQQLAESVIAADIDYIYGGNILGGLGDLSIKEPVFIEKMEKVVSLLPHGHVCFMCSEKDPSTCHRAMKLTAWLHVHHPEIVCEHIIPGKPRIDSKEFQKSMKKTWGWHELFPYGTYGAKKTEKQQTLDLT